MSAFYQLSPIARWTICLLFTAILAVITLHWIAIVNEHFYNSILIFLFVPVVQFFATPVFTLTGLYQYYAPMLITFRSSKTSVEIHNGTSFDYFLVFGRNKNKRPIKTWMLIYYLHGLLKIISAVKAGNLSNQATIKGSSYFFSEQTVKRMGFELAPTASFVKLNILVNYLDLLWMYSLAHGKLRFPNLNHIKTATISAENLLRQEVYIQKMHDYLRSKLNEN